MTDYRFREAEDEIDKPFWFKFWDWLVDYDRPLLGFLFRLPVFIILLLGVLAVVMWQLLTSRALVTNEPVHIKHLVADAAIEREAVMAFFRIQQRQRAGGE